MQGRDRRSTDQYCGCGSRCGISYEDQDSSQKQFSGQFMQFPKKQKEREQKQRERCQSHAQVVVSIDTFVNNPFPYQNSAP